MKGKIINVFPEGITSQGFCSFYGHILRKEDASEIIYVKDGSIIANSLIFRKIGTFFSDKGYDVEYHHCSLDPNKLLGIVIKDLKVALIDNNVFNLEECTYSNSKFEFLDMNECFNTDNYKDVDHIVTDICTDISIYMDRACKYLKASNFIHQNLVNLNSLALNISKINNLKDDMKNRIFKTSVSVSGYKRHLFATAFSSEGIVTYADDLYINYKNKYVLNGGPGTGKTNILRFLADEAFKRGYTVEIYHDPLLPKRVEHILIPEISTAIMTSNEINNIYFEGLQLYLGNFLDGSVLVKNKEEISQDTDNFKLLINKSTQLLSECKLLYDELDKYYVMDMNFDIVLKTINKLIDKIEEIEKKLSK